MFGRVLVLRVALLNSGISDRYHPLMLARGGPGAGAEPSSVASDDGSDGDGWRREPGADEVRENYMDSKFGGEGADMSESVMG